MSGPSIHSPLWHRIEKLKPRLRENVSIQRQVMRGKVWYVARELYTTRAHRFSPGVHFMLARMDGTRSFNSIWREAVVHFGEDAPSQDQILRAASQLYLAGVLHSDAAVDEGELAERAEKERARAMTANFRNPMFIRLPLFDPDRFLDATAHLARPLVSWIGAALWLAAMAWLGTQMFIHWRELTEDMTDRILSAQSLVTVVVVYPFLKILHEFGHAYAVKLAGQEVHEMGVMFLTLMPAPYVDASASAVVAEKWRRAGIAAAGMIVELAFAALAMLVWLKAQPGPMRSVAYDALFIASVSTLLFNGNPLLRFDAYYILSDLLEIPNLAARAQAWYLYLAQRHLFGLQDARDPCLAPGERFWFAVYAPASFVYRMITLFGIAVFVAGKYFFVGVVLTLWMIASALLWPMLKAIKYLLTSPELGDRRGRSLAAAGAVVAAIGFLVAVLPLPNGTVARGQVWIPDEARVVAQGAGTLTRFLVAPGEKVTRGQALAEIDDPFAGARRAKAAARLEEIEARLRAAEAQSPYELEMLRRQRDFAVADLAEMDRQSRDLTLRAPRDGRFIVPHFRDLQDNALKRGDTVGFVLTEGAPALRAEVPAAQIELVRDHVRAVAVRFDEQPWTRLDKVAITREAPQGTHVLPSSAMAAANGGPFAVTPGAGRKDGRDQKEIMVNSVFEIDLGVAGDFVFSRWGERVWVRFDHGASPLIARLYREARQLFLGRFHV